MKLAEPGSAPPRDHRVFWWKEALIASVFYAVYSWTRNQFGSNEIAADGVPEQAFTNAERIIRLESWMGLYREEEIQEVFLPYDWFIQFWNTFYGTAHFFVTLGVFVLLFLKRRDVFPQWRNTLAAMTALAIIGFAWFPLMPPRLLDEPCPFQVENEYGGACIASDLRGDDGFGFTDTLAEYGGPWSFDSETVASISNQYAAMPSLHIGWATWCAIAVWPLLRRRWLKIAVLLYPAMTLFCIVVTANHYWIDGVGGLVVFAAGALIGWGLHRWNQDRLDRLHLMGVRVATADHGRDDRRVPAGTATGPSPVRADGANGADGADVPDRATTVPDGGAVGPDQEAVPDEVATATVPAEPDRRPAPGRGEIAPDRAEGEPRTTGGGTTERPGTGAGDADGRRPDDQPGALSHLDRE